MSGLTDEAAERVMLRIRTWDRHRREWLSMADGLYAIDMPTLAEMRRAFAQEYASLRARGVEGFGEAPQTVAREIVLRRFPSLRGFDVIALGLVVTSPRIEVDGVVQPTDRRLAALAGDLC